MPSDPKKKDAEPDPEPLDRGIHLVLQNLNPNNTPGTDSRQIFNFWTLFQLSTGNKPQNPDPDPAPKPLTLLYG